MNRADELRGLLERVRAATYRDRDLDGDIFIATSPEVRAAGRIDHLHGVVGWWPRDAPYKSAREVPPYTASIDAALALVERKLPQARVYLAREPGSYSRAEIIEGRNHSTRLLADVERADDEAPLAIIAALLTALIAQKAPDVTS